MDKPAAVAKPESGDLKIVFSDSQAFAESVRKLFRPKPSVDAYSDDEDSDPEETSMFSKPVHEKKKKVKPDQDGAKAKTKQKTQISKKDFAKPWPEHDIRFDIALIKEMGFVRSEQKFFNDVKGYCFYREDGTSQFIRVEMLLLLKMAYKT